MKKIILLGLFIASLFIGGQNSFAQSEEKNNVNFGGHVFSGDFPITLGYAYLYNYNDLSIIIDTAVIDTLGYYYFYQVPIGYYQVMAGLHPDDPNYEQFAYTYYPDNVYWGDADPIKIFNTSWEFNIHLVNQDPELQVSGSGRIAGTLKSLDGKSIASNVDIMLCDENLNPLKHWPTNDIGEFSFENLAYGNYIIYPQIIGLETVPVNIRISNDQPEVIDVNITIKDGQIASFINEDFIKTQSFSLFPNPTASYLNIQFELKEISDYELKIYDLNGRLVYQDFAKATFGLNHLEINTKEWQNGYYFCDIIIQGNSALRQKMVVLH
ncbi:MAG: T9SS type A sorting domain-containing protein [Bacteroidales bacterium]|nr:T9SS type A sorting domain-containing protein [Bacteroidales bacterium]